MDILTTDVPFQETNNFDSITFGWVDYMFFGLLVLATLVIGVYFGLYTKQDTLIEYLLAGKRMKYIPVGVSVAISNLSGVALLGIQTEVFFYGSYYIYSICTAIIVALLIIYISLPVLYKLQLTSVFEYLELRFNKSVRILSSLIFNFTLLTYIPIVVYIPTLVCAQITHWDMNTITSILCILCIIYTSLGGLKAVVWADTLQTVVIVIGFLTTLYLGTISVGGFGEVWRIAGEGGRLTFMEMNPSPFVRYSFLTVLFGLPGIWFSRLAIHPGMVQRYLAVPTEKEAKYTVLLAVVIILIITLIIVLLGLVIYAKYHNCDPILTKSVKRPDQITAYYVMDVAGHLVGLPGLYLASLVSSTFAVMSTNLNSMSGTIYEDFLRPWLPDNIKNDEKKATRYIKVISVIYGLVTIGLVFVVDKLGTVFEMSVTMHSISDGLLMGLFILGFMVPWANEKGALVGGGFGMVIMSFWIGGIQWYKAHGRLKHHPLPTSVEGCPYPLNETISMTTTMSPTEVDPDDEPMIFFQISFLYFATIGALVVIVVGVIASYFFGMDLDSVNPDHITPFMRRFLPPRKYTEVSLKETPSFDVPE